MAKKRPTPAPARAKRQALRRNQIASLILHGSLTTTEARAKRLKSEVEQLIARAKGVDLKARRRILAFLPDKRAAKKLFDLVIPQFESRAGGFVRVVKLPPRRGDNALVARVEFVEEIKEAEQEVPAKGEPRLRRGSRKQEKKKAATKAKARKKVEEGKSETVKKKPKK